MKTSTKIAIALILFSTIIYAQKNRVQSLNEFKNNTGAIISTNNSFGTADFVRFSPEKSLSLQGNTIRDKATNFLNQYKSIYGLESIENSLKYSETRIDNYGLQHVIFKQEYHDVPVFDGELRFHFDTNNKLSSVNGNVLPDIQLNATARFSASEASNLAIDLINKQGINHSGSSLFVYSNKLYVFSKGLVKGYVTSYHLAHEVEVRNEVDVREFLYIDAHTGKLVEQFTGMAHAIDRVLYDGNTSNQIWQEGDAYPGTLDQFEQNALEASEHTYNFFNNAFGFVSYDGADAQMRTINNDENFINANRCPNASWNGVTTNYCPNTAADDVIAHEWGHAYTQFTSGLIYAWQSGALNEAYSDIWGETIDLINNYEDADEDLSLRTSCASSDRWRMGEDATSFAAPIRDMWDPTCNNDPGKVTDTQYDCDTDQSDNGGVHTNSGVPNRAYVLLVDGGTFNGETVASIGFTKAAHIFWRAQSVYLTPSSNFTDFADAIEASCIDLTGIDLEGLSTGAAVGPSGEIITAGDLQEVIKAINAVELRTEPTACNYQPILDATAELCEAATSNPLFFEDWESGLGSWTVEQVPTNPGTWESRDWILDASLPSNRVGTGVFGTDPVNGDCNTDLQNGIIRLQSPVITIPDINTGTFDMAFNHYIATEPSWDGGNIKYSLDGGTWTILPSTAFTDNAYNGVINNPNDNPLAGEEAFTGTDEGSVSGSWGQSIINLSSIGVVANSTIQFRWEMVFG